MTQFQCTNKYYETNVLTKIIRVITTYKKENSDLNSNHRPQQCQNLYEPKCIGIVQGYSCHHST